MIASLTLPNPLHPAVVHFPIVLLLLGAVAALAAAFLPRGRLPLVAAVCLSMGAVGSVAAVQTGERESKVIKETPAIESVLEEHEEWAERTQLVAIVAALLAIAAAVVTRWPKAARALNVVTALGAMAVTWCVVETGHYGGQLVYQHGAGVNTVSGAIVSTSAAPPASETQKRHADSGRPTP